MTQNPYAGPTTSTQITAEQTILIDRDGNLLPVGGKIEEVTIDATTGERRQATTHIVTSSADGQVLLFPFECTIYRCCVCHEYVTQADRCVECGAWVGANCKADDQLVICRNCKPLWQSIIDWFLGKGSLRRIATR